MQPNLSFVVEELRSHLDQRSKGLLTNGEGTHCARMMFDLAGFCLAVLY